MSLVYRVTVAMSPRMSLWPLGMFSSELRILTFLPMRLSVMYMPQSISRYHVLLNAVLHEPID